VKVPSYTNVPALKSKPELPLCSGRLEVPGLWSGYLPLKGHVVELILGKWWSMEIKHAAPQYLPPKSLMTVCHFSSLKENFLAKLLSVHSDSAVQILIPPQDILRVF